MKTNSKPQTRHPPTLTAHISFGEVGPDGERFIRVNIDIAKQRRLVLLRYDDFADGSRQALARLNALGAHLISSPAKSEFLRRLQDLGPQQPSFNVATRVGPFGKAFVLPHQVLSATEEDAETWFDDGLANYLSWAHKGGTLKKWKRLAALAEGNSRLILALGVAFVGPLRLIAPVESIVFQLTGFGGTGKTSIGVVASSIWGQRCLGGKPHPLGSGDAWNNTVSNLERVLATRDHTFLFLDEAHLARPQGIIAAIFMISEGQGRGRYNEISRWEWFVPVLSTSNDSVAELLARAREPPDRAAFDRLIDVPLPEGEFGAFENLHGSDTIGDFVLRLKAISAQNYGVVGRRYIRKILRELAEDKPKLVNWLEARRDYFIRIGRNSVSADFRHARVVSHLATVYAALRLADRYNLLKLPKDGVRDALLACLRDHLKITDSTTDSIIASSPIALLKAYVQKNRDNFVNLDGTRLPKGHNRAKRENKAARQPFRPRYAYKAGQLYLWYHVDYFSRTYETSPHFRRMTAKQAALALKMYFETAQVKKDVSHRGRTLSSLHNDKNRRRDLMFVYHVMDFLIRASLSGREDVCKAKIARFFVEKIEPMGEQLSPSKIEKAWNQYRDAAPYIYAFYPRLYCPNSQQDAFAEATEITEEDWIGRIAQLATKSTLEECLGHAAFAADVLAKSGTRAVRTRDFQAVPVKSQCCVNSTPLSKPSSRALTTRCQSNK